MIGQTLSHYHVLEHIGEGGMGSVYRARDERLEREVALKFLLESAPADDLALALFRREAQALSRLNHPYIATIYEFDQHEGRDFLVMEYVPGSPLSRCLEDGPLAEDEVVRIGTMVAEALDEAHAQGVLHRDLKPANIVLTPRGHVKLLDFGLAKLLQPAGSAATTRSITARGIAVGTLPYMSPEQLLGTASDARTDVYALGAVLYELAAGQPPFREPLATAMVAEILNRPATSLREERPQVSRPFDAIVLRCLAKDPERRYPSAYQVLADLRKLSAPEAKGGPRWARAGSHGDQTVSLAVLPLDNYSGDPEQSFFADGMTEALIADLAQIRALRVISRTSVMRYKSTRKSLPEIAKELDVDVVVEGSVLRSRERVRVTAQLIDAASDRHLWAKSYERDLSEIVSLQGELSRAIAGEIHLALTPQEEASLSRARPVDPAAHEAYLRGRHYWNRRNEESLRRAVTCFHEAIAADPDYALAHAGLADACLQLGNLAVLTPTEAREQARPAVQRALALDDRLAEAHTTLGMIAKNLEWDWSASERALRRALELKPGYSTAHHAYAIFLSCTGRHDEAIAEIRAARQLDPLSLIINTAVGGCLYEARRYDDAIHELRRTLELEAGFVPAKAFLALALAHLGRHDEALTEVLEAASLMHEHPMTHCYLGPVHALAGRRAEALRSIEMLVAMAKERHVSPYDVALIYACLGERDATLEWLEAAYSERAPDLVWLKVDPRLDPVRDEPRFGDLMRRVGLAS
ncbi:MAG TPA: protein kinase [Candidatus Limnocylindria bacterium]|nr:protein kinase [Candidatus Limnocylindria bacterium]